MPRFEDGPELNKLHQLFLQSMLLRRAAPKHKWLKVWKRCGAILDVAADAMTERAFDQFIGDCDVHLHKLGFKIAQTIDQGIGGVKEYQGQPASKVDGSGGANDKGGNTEPRKEGTKWLALVNFKTDDLAKVATDFNANEIAYFRKILDAIIDAPNNRFCVPEQKAVRAGRSVDPAIKYDQCEKLLATFVKQGWLSRSEKKNYSLSIRSQLELEHYIKSTYGDDALLECDVCHDPVFRGWLCGLENCQFVAHSMCLKRVLLAQGDNGPTCPACQQPWQEGIPIGEEAAAGDNVDSDPESSPEPSSRRKSSSSNKKAKPSTSASKKRTRSGKKKAASSDDDDDELVDYDEDDDDEVGKPAARRTSGRSTRNKKSFIDDAADDDDDEEESEESEDSVGDLQDQLTQLQHEEDDE